MTGSNLAVMLATALLIAGIGGYVIVSVSGDVGAAAQSAGEWCDDHDGELFNANVFGPHGGLHCELPNGTTVHMSDYVEVESA